MHHNLHKQPIILTIKTLKLLGVSTTLSIINNKTPELWSGFRRQQKQYFPHDPDYFYSVNVYPANYFDTFNPETPFVKHALVSAEYAGNTDLPWDIFELPGGLYAVFSHKGPDTSIFQYIYSTWLPSSGYQLDNRPHFEKIPSGYIPGHPESEEEIYIPVRAV